MRPFLFLIYLAQSIFFFWSFYSSHTSSPVLLRPDLISESLQTTAWSYRDFKHEDFLFGVLFLATAIGVIRYKAWGRWLAMGSAIYFLVLLLPYALHPAVATMGAHIVTALAGIPAPIGLEYFFPFITAIMFWQALTLWHFLQFRIAMLYSGEMTVSTDAGLGKHLMARRDYAILLTAFFFFGANQFKALRPEAWESNPELEAKAEEYLRQQKEQSKERAERRKQNQENREIEDQKQLEKSRAEAAKTQVKETTARWARFAPDERSILLGLNERPTGRVAIAALPLTGREVQIKEPAKAVDPRLVSEDGKFAVTSFLDEVINLETQKTERLVSLDSSRSYTVRLSSQPPGLLIYDGSVNSGLIFRHWNSQSELWRIPMLVQAASSSSFLISPSRAYVFALGTPPTLVDFRNGKGIALQPSVPGEVTEVAFDDDETTLIYTVQNKTTWKPESFVYTISTGQSQPLPFVAKSVSFSIKEDVLFNRAESNLQFRKPSLGYSMVWEKNFGVFDYLHPRSADFVLLWRWSSKFLEVMDLKTQELRGIGQTFDRTPTVNQEKVFVASPSGALIVQSHGTAIQVFWRQEMLKPRPAWLNLQLPKFPPIPQ
jgi:hypothetical protein